MYIPILGPVLVSLRIIVLTTSHAQVCCLTFVLGCIVWVSYSLTAVVQLLNIVATVGQVIYPLGHRWPVGGSRAHTNVCILEQSGSC